MKSILVTSGYGGNTREPFIMIEGDQIDEAIQMSPTDARELALNLLQAAEAAETDAFMVEFIRNELEGDDEHVLGILVAFRKFREQKRGGKK